MHNAYFEVVMVHSAYFEVVMVHNAYSKVVMGYKAHLSHQCYLNGVVVVHDPDSSLVVNRCWCWRRTQVNVQ